ncbi:TetR/AcrR family transcriptional regulator [Romeria aff. gracilis LEGE 07310]|uniref:TetR/AcrR family transcriptional regulator n=1 Tax=Vasconcelosia minhoensis LEGE 07310 TaxID=915328 RepID=A0A8J7AIF3_9CYAN|nr:TetR/AcrR family transcriptional regulator [Romeria gracilis]MBE9075990.1 TetR/AcrR family transcriptional regulator [Romeria aff. gracilis LEGE 07310]
MIAKTPLDLKSPKARQILEGAKTAFLELGYEGASTDEIVRRAGVSKGTLYNYFPDKQSLFRAFVEGECQRQISQIFEISNPEDTESTLREIAQHIAKLLTSPAMHSIFRLVAAETPRFPDLARTFFDSGPDLGVRRLAQFLAAAVARGDLKIDDIELAASQFEQLCRADIFHKQLFHIRQSFTQSEIDRVADGAVYVFLRAYHP